MSIFRYGLAAVLLGSQIVSVVAEEIDFEQQIRPLLIMKCGECHGPDDQHGGLRLDARHAALKGGDSGGVIVPGSSRESELLRRITSSDDDERMPPEGERLDESQVELLARWIDAGAVWPETDYDRQAKIDRRLEHWAFQPLREAGSNDSIDRFVEEKLSENGLAFSDFADRRTLIRRLWFDMLGLPPTIEQVKKFESNDDPEAWKELVETALSSPRYGERWAQHWLDVIRYADTHGFEVNTPRENAWPYRDYVIGAFNEDKPYDQFILEQLAGDALNADEATGFLVAAAVLLPGQIGKDEESKRLARQDALDEIIQGTGATLLGLTIGCARCHDHKFDPITQHDYYSMQAFFAGVEYGDRPVMDANKTARLARTKELAAAIARLEEELHRYEPIAVQGRTLIIDEQDSTHVTFLKEENGPGSNPVGTQRGYKDDVGSATRIGNLSRGQYTWWNNVPGEDVLTYAPSVTGRFRLWLSWGAHGSGVHTRDARYVLDKDGDLTTRDDQQEIARIDQYYLAGVSKGETEQKPLWSGLLNVGEFELTDSTKLILRGGETGTGITADVIVLQEVSGHSLVASSKSQLPSLRAPISAKRNIEQFEPTEAKFVRFTSFETIDDNRHEPCIDELEVFESNNPSLNVALASRGSKATSSGNYSNTGKHQLKHVNDGRYGNDRSWISNEHGKGWVQIEFPEVTEIHRIVWGRDREEKFKDRLAVRYKIEVSTNGKDWQRVAGHEDRVPMGTPHDQIKTLLRSRQVDETADLTNMVAEVEQLKAEKKRLETPRMVYAGKFREPDTTFVLRRGDPEQRLDEVEPAVPVMFTSHVGRVSRPVLTAVTSQETRPTFTAEQERRLSVARWIVSAENPLTARVMVNRIWMYHFGRGLVTTPSDFGLNGLRPSHPKLLDWLAGEFIRSGWSVKHIHRLILTSKTYKQSHRVDAVSTKIDRDNKWLWRFASRRLEGEAIRDSMLAVSGELNLKMGGPGFNFFKSRGGLSGFPPVTEFNAEEMRRMIYSHKIRMERVPVFGAFDCPDAGQATPIRSRSTTAIQALNLFNSDFVAARAEKFAERVEANAGNDKKQQVRTAFELAFSRAATETERAASIEVVEQHGLATLGRVLFNSNEFLFLP